ncbi:hypothetical protein B0H14DRAFT_3770189 [Mycena olivaceomarginata]|nr:hypothetical protein B0H14DRAFT_3770189 [Mycena olivaceomarginata]
MGYGMVWHWERSDHCAEWIWRGSGDGDGEDAGQPSELEASNATEKWSAKFFQSFFLPANPSLNTFFLQLKSGGLWQAYDGFPLTALFSTVAPGISLNISGARWGHAHRERTALFSTIAPGIDISILGARMWYIHLCVDVDGCPQVPDFSKDGVHIDNICFRLAPDYHYFQTLDAYSNNVQDNFFSLTKAADSEALTDNETRELMYFYTILRLVDHSVPNHKIYTILYENCIGETASLEASNLNEAYQQSSELSDREQKEVLFAPRIFMAKPAFVVPTPVQQRYVLHPASKQPLKKHSRVFRWSCTQGQVKVGQAKVFLWSWYIKTALFEYKVSQSHGVW